MPAGSLPRSSHDESRAQRAERFVLLTVAVGAVLAPLNSTMIAVALPSITTELASSAATTSWLVTAYLISMASLQPVAGRLGDRLGRRRLMIGGLIGFGMASLGAAFAPNLPLLIACRVAQAVSGAVVLPNGDALLREIVPDERRASRFGLIGSAIGLAAALGPVLGGLLVSSAGWRTMFAVNLLLVLPALTLGLRWLPRPAAMPNLRTASTAADRTVHTPFDWKGSVMLSAGLVALALLLSRGGGLSGPLTFGAVVGLFAFATFFVRHELRHPEPVLQPRFFLRSAYATATGGVGLSNLAMYSVLLVLPIIWAGKDRPAAEIGMLLGMMAAAMVICSPIGGRLADRIGRRWPATLGMSVLTVGALMIAVTTVGRTVEVSAATDWRSLWPIMLGLMALGSGLGLATPAMQAAALESIERKSAGAAAGLYSTSRYLGSIVGSALLARLLAAESTGSDAGPASATNTIFVIIVVAALISICLTTRLPGGRPRPSP